LEENISSREPQARRPIRSVDGETQPPTPPPTQKNQKTQNPPHPPTIVKKKGQKIRELASGYFIFKKHKEKKCSIVGPGPKKCPNITQIEKRRKTTKGEERR